MIKTVLFDLGNTLYKNKEFDKQYPGQLTLLLAKDREITVEEAKSLLDETASKLEKESSKHVTKVATMEAMGYSRSQVHEAFCKNNPKDYLSEDQKLAEMLATLSEKYKLGIVSNFKSSHTLEILEALGIKAGLFDVIIGEDNVVNIKPDPEGFHKALETADCKPEEAVYVADSLTKDLIPAKSVGLKTLQVGGDYQKDESVDRHIGIVYELPEALNSL